MPVFCGGENQGRSQPGPDPDRSRHLALAITVFVLMIGVGVGLGAKTAAGDEATPATESTAVVPTPAQTEEALEETTVKELAQGPETDPQAAEELPHRGLDGEEALELVEGVFGTQLEEPTGIYDELEPEKFLSDNAAIVPASSISEAPGEAKAGEPEAVETPGPPPPEQPLLIESTLPLRTRNAEGEEEAVDLTLQSPEGSGGELQPVNPLAELSIPAHLGEGLSVGEVGISVAGAPQESAPTNVEGQYAFYPNVAENTDLVVAPTPTGAEAFTQIRSAEAPTSTTYELTLPDGAELKAGKGGGAEVLQGDRTTMIVPPPTATDAAGETVPVELVVAGDDLRVIASPGPAVAYPILVDPVIEFVSDEGSWYSPEGLKAWTSGTSQSSLCPVGYASWIGPSVPGLELNSGCDTKPVPSGTVADWTYMVPRYGSDIKDFGSPPTSYIQQLMTQNVVFETYGNNKAYPVLLWGLISPTTGWGEHITHYGTAGGMNRWEEAFASNNVSSEPQLYQEAGMFLETFENEASAVARLTFIGRAVVAVVDTQPPVLKKLESPKKWMNTTAEPITFEVEDTGLGVETGWASYEGATEPGFGFNLGCPGTAVNPCPRKVSSAGGQPFGYDPKVLPTGEDRLSLAFDDVVFTSSEGHANHVAGGLVTLKIDHTAPEVTLSGALIEQEKLGTLESEYPLTIKATDGTAAEPQSGVARVEVKVDGKKVTMPNESAWNPNCATENCAFTGTWTLKTSEYTATSHEVEVLVTDGAGVVTSETLEIDLGEAPPQTSFTSPHPSHEAQEIETISFRATRGGAPVEGATFRCSLDGAPATACTSPLPLPEHLEDKEHTFTVAAVDKTGKVDPTPATWRFETSPYPPAPANEKLVFPETGKQSASYFTLEAEWGANPEGKAGEGVTGVTFQVNLSVWHHSAKHRGNYIPPTFETIPAECVIDGHGRPVSWPLAVHTHPGHTAPVYFKVRGCSLFEEAEYPEKELQFRAVFDGGSKVAGASAPATTEFVSRVNGNRVATDATESVGPGTVDLLTGAFTMSRTDVSIPVPGYEANLEFTRTYSSTFDTSLPGYSYVLGGAWQPGSPLESEGEGEAWSRIEKQVIEEHPAVYDDECWNEEEETVGCAAKRCNGNPRCEEWEEEPFQPHEEWIELIDTEGAAVIFEIDGQGNFVAPEYAMELKLTYQGKNLVLASPNGSQTIFEESVKNEWNPAYVTFQATPSSMRLVFFTGSGGEKLLYKEIAPNPDPTRCTASQSESEEGCRTLVFHYHHFEIPGHFFQGENKLVEITYSGPQGGPSNATPVAQYEYKLVSTTEWPSFWGTSYTQEEMLIGERDPRLPSTIPAETYSYDETPGYGNLMSRTAPPGQEPWIFEYEHGNWVKGGIKPTKLKAVTRAGAKTTIAYGVPTHGSAAPYAMGSEDISKWGQTDLPVDATAIFPPNHVPSEYPPHEYTGATIHYMDPEGHQVNTATPSPPGVNGASIATTETDMKGNVVRELDPQNRLIALESSESATVAHQLDSHSTYNAAGTELLESWGPLHMVRLEGTSEVPAREHTTTRYDEGEPTPLAGTPPAYLPTKETVAAVVPGKEGEFEPRVTETKYEWKHRLPEEKVVDPTGLKIRMVSVYNAAGQVEEIRQPKGAEKFQTSGTKTAGDTKTIYYSATTAQGDCPISATYANLPCEVLPAVNESGTGRSQLPVKKFTAYNYLDEPTSIIEYPQNEPTQYRKTVTRYDEAGRVKSTLTVGGGISLARTEARTETVYSPTLGLPIEEKFVCEPEHQCTSINPEAIKTEYNTLGQVTKYIDADGAETKTTYDAYGRPAIVTDPKGTQALRYDETSGLLTSMEVSKVGTFTATYDADGDLIARGLPNGLTATTTYNQANEPMKLAYTKASSCGKSCTWYEESLERSIEGRILYSSSLLVKDNYRYDKDGRLVEAQETPTEGAQCTSREYKYDADSNRMTKTPRSPGVGGACATSGGTPESYNYDEADRLIGPTYDAWGRITTLPAEFAGGKELKTSYFANDMVATQEQSAVTNTFQLDATGRQRQREQAGGVAGVEIFHYDGPGDSPAWTALGTTWSRNIPGIGGELAAVQESSGGTTTTTFKLTDLHGDAVASASSSPTAENLLTTFRFSEFGEPLAGGAGRFGWLGGKSRRTELSSGVIQMGARSYIPQLGRFLTPDPEPGGSANAYDYSNQDPVNRFDLSGKWPSFAGNWVKRYAERIRKAAVRLARQHPHRAPQKCEFSSGCSAHVVREGVYKVRGGNTGWESVQHLASIMTGVVTGKYQWHAAKALVHAWISSTEDPAGQKVWSCAKNMDDVANEMDPETDATVGWLAMLGSCAWGASE